MISVLVVTYNETLHLERCLESLRQLSDDIHIVDSFSSDDTRDIAHKHGAHFVQHPWINYATQFQWGLDHCPLQYDWVLKMDADEYLEPALVSEIHQRLPDLPEDVTGIYLKRKVFFKGRWIRHGGFYPHILLRIWRRGAGSIEQRWMDEHPVLSHGRALLFREHLVDENLHDIHWWIDKHNRYAIREMVDLLNLKYHFLDSDERLLGGGAADKRLSGEAAPGAAPAAATQARRKRWLKERVYAVTPSGLRAGMYFFYRYFLRAGFLDGYPGFIFHFMQGFWYRLLVDVNVAEVERKTKEDRSKDHIRAVLRKEYQVDL